MNFDSFHPLKIVLATCFVIALSFGYVVAAEHAGEHPGGETDHHTGEQTKDKPSQKTFSADEIKTAIRSYILTDQKLKNGFFYLYDRELERDWKLTFTELHPVRVIDRKDETIYFACTNFAVHDDENHEVLDLDFWMKPENGKLEPYRIRIHKVDGEARFTYEDDKPVEK